MEFKNLEIRRIVLERGFEILPIYSVTKDGTCYCGKADCPSIGKHPISNLVHKGHKDATGNLDLIQEWFTQYPNANVGCVVSENIFVLDIDPRNGGDISLQELTQRYEPLPKTLTCETGGNGLHLYFKTPKLIHSYVKELAAGIDIKSSKGYLIIPPSKHASGRVYKWANELDIATAPNWLIDMVTKNTSFTVDCSKAPSKINKAAIGSRNNFLASLAGKYVRLGMSKERLLENLLKDNVESCQPPLTETEIQGIAKSISNYSNQSEPDLYERMPLLLEKEIDSRIKNIIKSNAQMDFDNLPKPIKEFVLWAQDSTFAANEFIALGAYCCIPPLLGNKASLSFSTGNIKPHLYLACLADSSTGKTSGLNIAAKLLMSIIEPLEEENTLKRKQYAIDKKRFDKDVIKLKSTLGAEDEPIRPSCRNILLPTITSMQRIIEMLALDQPTGFSFVPTELSIILSDWKADRNEGIAHFFMGLFDSPAILPSSNYKSCSDLPPIKDPSVTIAGASTPKSFFKRFTEEDLYSGNLQRWLIATTKSKKPKQACPPLRSKEGELLFQNFFNALLNFSYEHKEGYVMELSHEAKLFWEAVYTDLTQEFKTDDTEDYVISSLERIKDSYTLKFALINEVATQVYEKLYNQKFRYTTEISLESLQQAIALTKYFMQSLVDVINQMSMHNIVACMKKIVRRLRKSKYFTCNRNDLKTELNGYRNPEVFDQALNLLEDLGIITLEQVENNSNNGSSSLMVALLQESTTVLLSQPED